MAKFFKFLIRCHHTLDNGHSNIGYKCITATRFIYQSHWCLDGRLFNVRVWSAARVCPSQLCITFGYDTQFHTIFMLIKKKQVSIAKCIVSPFYFQQNKKNTTNVNLVTLNWIVQPICPEVIWNEENVKWSKPAWMLPPIYSIRIVTQLLQW